MTTTRPRPDPYSSFNFVLELEGRPIAGFSEVSGLGAETDVVDYRDGVGKAHVTRQPPGLHKVTHLMLHRGTVDGTAFAQWQAGGTGDRRRATIVLYDQAHRPVRRWHVVNARIIKFTGPSLAAASNDVAIESLELMYDGVELED